jgi:hypothetical protein
VSGSDEALRRLRAILVAISRRTDYGIRIVDDSHNTAVLYDDKVVVIGNKTIPDDFRKYPKFFTLLQQGLAAHESAHIKYTAHTVTARKSWASKKDKSGLATHIEGVVADKVTNTNTLLHYKYDFGKYLKSAMDALGRCWYEHIKEDLESGEITKNDLIVSLVGLKGLYGLGDDLMKDDETKRAVDKCVNILSEVSYDITTEKTLKTCEQIYAELSKYAEPTEKLRGIPTFLGGLLVLKADDQSLRLARAMEAEEGGDKEGGKILGSTVSAGSGSGLEIPSPKINLADYNRRLERYTSEVNKILNMLKKNLNPVQERERWRSKGRFMSEILGQAYVHGQRHDVSDVYQRNETVFEKKNVAICLLLDLSGSMDIDAAKDILTILTEVGLRYLKDEQLAILTFGSSFQKIKVFVESAYYTRGRIGGTECLGGTTMAPPLRALRRMFNSLRGNGNFEKVLVIGSDFSLYDEKETREEIKNLTDDDVRVVGVGLCHSGIWQVKKFTKYATYVNKAAELPEKFVKIYMDATNSYAKQRIPIFA